MLIMKRAQRPDRKASEGKFRLWVETATGAFSLDEEFDDVEGARWVMDEFLNSPQREQATAMYVYDEEGWEVDGRRPF